MWIRIPDQALNIIADPDSALNINGDSDQDPDMDPNQTIKYGNRAVDPDPHGSRATWIRIHWPFWIRIHIQNADPDPGGKN